MLWSFPNLVLEYMAKYFRKTQNEVLPNHLCYDFTYPAHVSSSGSLQYLGCKEIQTSVLEYSTPTKFSTTDAW